MIKSFYDVVVVGSRLSALTSAALLAKRGFRVLLIGHEDLPARYEVEGLSLPRAPFSFIGAHSPVARRIFSELAISQAFRQKAIVRDPSFALAMPGHRFEMASEGVHLEREIRREFPEVERPVRDFLSRALELDALIDRALENEVGWPPESFFERREHSRATSDLEAELSRTTSLLQGDPLRELPDAHPFRLVVHVPVRFSEGIDPDHASALRIVRHFSGWRRGAADLEGGEAELRSILEGSFQAHGGELRARDRIDALLTKRGGVEGVRIAASGEEIGASFVLLGAEIGRFLRLVEDRRPFEELFESVGEPVPRYYRYTLNVVLRDEGVPDGLCRDTFFVRDPRRPLSDANLLHIERSTLGEGRTLLSIETLLPRRGVEDIADYVETLRERVLASIGELVPFLDKHVVLVDSPHDDRPPRDMVRNIDLPHSARWHRGIKTMEMVQGFPIASHFGLCALPLRTPIKRLLLCNGQVTPGLGIEGQLLTAWSAARLVSRSDKRPVILRRGLWTKLES